MDPFTWSIIGGVALATGLITFFATRHAANIDDENIKQHINNQIIIAQEKDNAHEFAQYVVLAILIFIASAFIIIYCVKFAVQSIVRQTSKQVKAQEDNI